MKHRTVPCFTMLDYVIELSGTELRTNNADETEVD